MPPNPGATVKMWALTHYAGSGSTIVGKGEWGDMLAKAQRLVKRQRQNGYEVIVLIPNKRWEVLKGRGATVEECGVIQLQKQ